MFCRDRSRIPTGPPVKGDGAGPWKLPPRLVRMVGRDEAVQHVSAQLIAGRFVSIVGPGGMGKTTVAVSVAHSLLNGFSGGVSFIDLGALTDPQFVPTAVASALGFMMVPRTRSAVSWRFSATRRYCSFSTIVST